MGAFSESSIPNTRAAVATTRDTERYFGNKHRPNRKQKIAGRRKLMAEKENEPELAVTSFSDVVMRGNAAESCGCVERRNDWPAYDSSDSSDETNNNCYYDMNLAQKCHKMLYQHAGKSYSSKVLLFPEEEWARNAYGIQWGIKMNRWWKRYCTITEHRAGGRPAVSALGKIVQNRDGTLTILGRFKRNKDPDFRLHLSGRVTKDDFERGYLMTGALQLGDLKGEGRLEITHFAVVPRHQQSIIN
uniref:Uncharacterized protein n=1 Tax=Ciona savignyi TaxID=51511 RepID=H2ZIM2_CIOSA